MFSQAFITEFVDFLVSYATDWLLPTMAMVFFLGSILRILVWHTVRREEWFAKEFEKRVTHYMESKERRANHGSFFIVLKYLLEKTYYELFKVREIMKRRNPDFVMDRSDRFFLIQPGCARLVKDVLRHVKFLKYTSYRPKLHEITKVTFQNNPCFNRALGFFPVGLFNDILNILPGIFIIGGIFGTFLGIMKALPELSGMDLNDVAKTQEIMGEFLGRISFSMSTSIIGIVLSVSMSFLNTSFSPEKAFMDTVDRFTGALDIIWNKCEDNRLPNQVPNFREEGFDINIEKNAELAVMEELARYSGRKLEDVRVKYLEDHGITVEKKGSSSAKNPPDEEMPEAS